ncbi:MAG: OLD family endonuclease [Pseudoalteromonas sp.]|uniref:AAA family ATPase n=1 Tax=Pseudoalteromonas sp. TaxID=53249 RepID=UPI000C976A24|nr:AAA family ATPase [Pseudoalteromonas sp.]MAD04867.1 OLD family endonuclease [Pseudoalteromonas sp.]|tara:strand:- start:17622 stop:18866 length:1245 start_codon:yes stop_codon:yes gene_type:complete
MKFRKIKFSEWQQFEKIDIDLSNRVTVLTGTNGSGKTTILNQLARHSGWQFNSLSTPKEDKATGIVKFTSPISKSKEKFEPNLGSIEYENGSQASLVISQTSNAAQYDISIKGKQNIPCFYIPSHRPIFRYKTLANIPTAKQNKQKAFDAVSNVNKQRYHGQEAISASFIMKNTLIGWAIKGYGVNNRGKVIMPADLEQINNFEGFQAVLKKILPATLGFEELAIRNMEIVLVCNGGSDEFLLETASGGVSALIDIAWQIFMFSSTENSEFTVIIDEIENHLHPTLQRLILQSLVDAFPNAYFVVSTHSPLVVGSVKHSKVYVLRYNSHNKVESQELDLVGEAKTATEILDEVLGVSFTMPVWVEQQLKSVISEFSSSELNANSFHLLKSKLSEMGLEKMLPHTIQCVLDHQND